VRPLERRYAIAGNLSGIKTKYLIYSLVNRGNEKFNLSLSLSRRSKKTKIAIRQKLKRFFSLRSLWEFSSGFLSSKMLNNCKIYLRAPRFFVVDYITNSKRGENISHLIVHRRAQHYACDNYLVGKLCSALMSQLFNELQGDKAEKLGE
jgi:hypothetical protein